RVPALLEASGVAGLGQELLRALRVVGRDLPLAAVALVERIVVVGERRVGALALPERVDDGLLVDGEFHRQSDLPRVLAALGIAPVPGPRTGRAVVLAIGCGLAAEDDPVARGIRDVVQPEPGLDRLIEVVAEDDPDVDLTGPEPGQARRGV